MPKLTRRQTLKYGGAAAATLAAAPLMTSQARAQSQNGKLLFVITASGGGSILDSFLPVLSSEGNGGNTWAAAQVQQPPGSNLRCIVPQDNSIEGAIALGNQYEPYTYLSKHAADTVVMTQECTSVNHIVAAKRAMTGNNVNRGRTISEAAAVEYGQGMILPNANMVGGGYLENGTDSSVPDWARAEPIADARLFAFSTHGSRGVKNAPSQALLNQARGVREDLENASGFGRTFKNASLLNRYLARRNSVVGSMEADDLITKLMLFREVPGVPLTEYDLETTPLGQTILDKFPDVLTDPFEAQASLAFLLTRYGVSCAVTIGPNNSPVFESTERIISAPIAFDWSHNDHRGGQNAMWSRILKTMDGLIDLLKESDHLGDPSMGKMWDRSMVYVATEFGRDKVSSGGSGHNLNNGNVLVSPMLNGNQVYGGVDPNSCLTYGFDPVTGAPDTGTVMREEHVYSAVAQGMGISFQGQVNMDAMVKNT